ncbi:MAG: MmcQ/YjbR family DNA-binding protein [Bacteroidota bacterium]
MVSIDSFRKLVLSFPEAEEKSHFHKTSFRVKKKIFATLDEKEKLAVLKFSPVDQSVFSDISKGAIYPVHGAWGKKGFTYVNLAKIKKDMLVDAAKISYSNIAPAKLAAAFTSKQGLKG